MVSPALNGVFRSLRLYHGPQAPRVAMDSLYSGFVEAGDLVFDVGAHVGDRVSSFRRLGARVIAVEPQWLLLSALDHVHGRDPLVTIVGRAAAAESGTAVLHINSANPTVSTLSDTFIAEARAAEGWQGQIWDDDMAVETVTLDNLIARYGEPAFTKIDTEGFEDAVLRGLSRPLKALSFEFTTIGRGVAMACFDRLSELADYRYNYAPGESQTLTFPEWKTAEEIAGYLSSLPQSANSGDVYARAVR